MFFYLDDGWMCGDDTAVARAFAELQRLAPEIGLAKTCALPLHNFRL